MFRNSSGIIQVWPICPVHGLPQACTLIPQEPREMKRFGGHRCASTIVLPRPGWARETQIPCRGRLDQRALGNREPKDAVSITKRESLSRCRFPIPELPNSTFITKATAAAPRPERRLVAHDFTINRIGVDRANDPTALLNAIGRHASSSSMP
jgi:hypothetical protein